MFASVGSWQSIFGQFDFGPAYDRCQNFEGYAACEDLAQSQRQFVIEALKLTALALVFVAVASALLYLLIRAANKHYPRRRYRYKLTKSNRQLANFLEGIEIDEEKSRLWSEQNLAPLLHRPPSTRELFFVMIISLVLVLLIFS